MRQEHFKRLIRADFNCPLGVLGDMLARFVGCNEQAGWFDLLFDESFSSPCQSQIEDKLSGPPDVLSEVVIVKIGGGYGLKCYSVISPLPTRLLGKMFIIPAVQHRKNKGKLRGVLKIAIGTLFAFYPPEYAKEACHSGYEK